MTLNPVLIIETACTSKVICYFRLKHQGISSGVTSYRRERPIFSSRFLGCAWESKMVNNSQVTCAKFLPE